MKTMVRRSLPLCLAALLICSLGLSGCQKKEVVPPDQMAEAIFEMTFRQDTSKAAALFGYSSEEQARDDLLGEETDLQAEIVESMVGELDSTGLGLTEEELTPLADAVFAMLGKLDFSAEVKEMDEKAKTAAVTCRIGYYDEDEVNEASEELLTDMMETMDLETLMTEEGMAQFMKDFLLGYAQIVSQLEPAEGTKEVEVPFELVEAEINGKNREVWMPVDAESFGFDLSTAALGA